MTIVLVRHAVALARHKWDGPDAARPLTERGQRQAEALVEALLPCTPAAIYSSRAVRCVETIAPLAEKVGLDVQLAQELFEGARTAALRLIDEHRSSGDEGALVLCSHGDVLPELLLELTSDVGDDPSFAKGAAWIVDDGRARYVPPPA